MAGSYTLPQVQVFQTFSMAPNDVTQNLNPFVIGPRFLAIAYADKSTRNLCTHKTYDGSQLSLAWSDAMPEKTVVDKGSYGITLADTYVKISASQMSGTPTDGSVVSSKTRQFDFSAIPLGLVAGDYLKYGNGGQASFAKIMRIKGVTVTLDTDIPVTESEAVYTPVVFTAARLIGVTELDVDTHTQLDGETGVKILGSATVKVDGVDLDILSATAYLNQRSLRTDNCNVIGNVASDSEIVAKCGPIVPSNPLAYALHCTLRNCASATIHYMAIESDDIDGWRKALDHATNTNDVYALCPITEAKDVDPEHMNRTEIIDEVEKHCDEMSQADKKSWRIAFVSSIPKKLESETASKHAQAVANESSRLANHRVYNVFPGSLRDISGQTVDGMYAAAAVCGLACSVLPQQPITNVEVEGFLDIPATYAEYSRADLDTIAGGGTLIVMQDRAGGVIYVRHQISTAYAKGEGVATAELSMVRNLDSISYYFANRFAPYIGKYNITPDLLAELKAVLHDGLSFLKTATEGNRLIGPQLLDEGTEIKSIYQHPQQKDHVSANIILNLPAPFNNFDLYLDII